MLPAGTMPPPGIVGAATAGIGTAPTPGDVTMPAAAAAGVTGTGAIGASGRAPEGDGMAAAPPASPPCCPIMVMGRAAEETYDGLVKGVGA